MKFTGPESFVKLLSCAVEGLLMVVMFDRGYGWGKVEGVLVQGAGGIIVSLGTGNRHRFRVKSLV